MNKIFSRLNKERFKDTRVDLPLHIEGGYYRSGTTEYTAPASSNEKEYYEFVFAYNDGDASKTHCKEVFRKIYKELSVCEDEKPEIEKTGQV